MFGGSSTNRRSRLLSASPYTAAAISSRKPHQRPLFEDSASSRRGSSAANTPSPAPSPSPSSTTSNDNGLMSSTARLIFDTLEKMSTPVRDAQKLIPSVSLSSPPRGEKRRLIAEQLDWCHDSLKRRRPRLGQSDSSRGTDHLNGPPLRTVFSPLPPTPKPRSTATKSARLSASTKATSIAETSTSAASSNLSLSKAFTPKPDLQGLPSTMVQPNVPSLEKNYLAVGSGGGGKIRAKVCETTRGQKSETFDPTPAFIASHNAPLPLKSLPVISYNCDNSNKTKPGGMPPFSNSSKPPTRIESANFSELPKGTKMSFKFAEPSPVKANSDNDLEDHENGVAHFSFCRPEEVKASSLSFCKEKSPSPVLTRTTNISGHHHSKLPDITAQMTQDVLGRKYLNQTEKAFSL